MPTRSRRRRQPSQSRDRTSRARRQAQQAGLRYYTDERPGIRRRRGEPRPLFVSVRGKRIRDAATLARIRSLAIPPAWKNVWIAPDRDAHLQATGRDARGRKQYRYHNRWREVRDSSKYSHLVRFARALPKIRRRVASDLRRKGLPKPKVLAAVVRLLETSLIRVGNDEYARQNHSFGLTTMRDRHARVRGRKILFRFRGKSGIDHDIDLDSAVLARIVRHCQELPGQELFQYLDEQDRVHDIGSADVNAYLREIAGEEITAKDFRTWAGTRLAAAALQEFEEFDSHARAKRNITCAIESVAQQLGNTAAVCRKCYVHPAVIDAYLDRSLIATLQHRARRALRRLHSLSPEEAAVLALLQERLQRALQPGRGSTRGTRI